jgi:hypothetical protein
MEPMILDTDVLSFLAKGDTRVALFAGTFGKASLRMFSGGCGVAPVGAGSPLGFTSA